MTLPPNLATDDIISEAWVDAVVTELTDLAPGSTRYPPKPSAGVVYGVNHYQAAAGAAVVLANAATTLLTIAMPAAPAGTLLDISMMGYVNQGSTGTTGSVLFASVNGVQVNPQIVIGDRVQLESYSGRIVNVAAPVGVAYNIVFAGQKLAAGGSIQLQSLHTAMSVVSYRP